MNNGAMRDGMPFGDDEESGPTQLQAALLALRRELEGTAQVGQSSEGRPWKLDRIRVRMAVSCVACPGGKWEWVPSLETPRIPWIWNGVRRGANRGLQFLRLSRSRHLPPHPPLGHPRPRITSESCWMAFLVHRDLTVRPEPPFSGSLPSRSVLNHFLWCFRR